VAGCSKADETKLNVLKKIDKQKAINSGGFFTFIDNRSDRLISNQRQNSLVRTARSDFFKTI